jgi:hypothetical protein
MQEVEWCLPGAGSGASGELLFYEYRISVLQDDDKSWKWMG